jgi:hypothetical protein
MTAMAYNGSGVNGSGARGASAFGTAAKLVGAGAAAVGSPPSKFEFVPFQMADEAPKFLQFEHADDGREAAMFLQAAAGGVGGRGRESGQEEEGQMGGGGFGAAPTGGGARQADSAENLRSAVQGDEAQRAPDAAGPQVSQQAGPPSSVSGGAVPGSWHVTSPSASTRQGLPPPPSTVGASGEGHGGVAGSSGEWGATRHEAPASGIKLKAAPPPQQQHLPLQVPAAAAAAGMMGVGDKEAVGGVEGGDDGGPGELRRSEDAPEATVTLQESAAPALGRGPRVGQQGSSTLGGRHDAVPDEDEAALFEEYRLRR